MKVRNQGRIATLALLVLLTAGCSREEVARGFLPKGVTNVSDRITNLWTGSWIAALAVGVLTWGLIAWCVVVYRKRKNDESLPVQLRYHVPLEIMYTIIPVLMVGTLFYFTARDAAAIEDVSQKPAHTVQVVAKQWSWDFNYVDENVFSAGVQAHTATGALDQMKELPALYLPVGERVEFVLDSRDVVHSFWVPQFLYKKDIIPGHTNRFQIVPEVEGTYLGKCAELCGEYHGDMLFQVKVVARDTYERYIKSLHDGGNVGQLGSTYDRLQHPTSGKDK